MPRIYKIIERKNPYYEEMKEKYQDKPEFLEDLVEMEYWIAEVSFGKGGLEEEIDQKQYSDAEILESVRSFTGNLLRHRYDNPKELIWDLEMMLDDLKKSPLVLNIEKQKEEK